MGKSHEECPYLDRHVLQEDNTWKKDSVQPGPESAESTIHANSRVVVILASANDARKCETCQRWFIETFHMPQLWWTYFCKRSNGYFGCETEMNDQGKIVAFTSWTRFIIKQLFQNSHAWYKINSFTRSLHSKQTIIVLFDAPTQLKNRLPGPVFDNYGQDLQIDPFWVQTRLVQEVVDVQNQTVWDIRDRVRMIEKTRTKGDKPNPDYERLHDMARHAIHVSETLDVAVKTMETMAALHKDSLETFEIGAIVPTDLRRKVVGRRVREQLLFFTNMIESLQYRSNSNKERLLNEIQLAFNTVAQYDSGVSVRIGAAAKADSAAMKTVAGLTLAFLPATFISSVFSMSFFSYEGEATTWVMSDKFWLYWAIAIPVTMLTAVLWYFWRQNMEWEGVHRKQEDDEKQQMVKSRQSWMASLRGTRQNTRVTASTWS